MRELDSSDTQVVLLGIDDCLLECEGVYLEVAVKEAGSQQVDFTTEVHRKDPFFLLELVDQVLLRFKAPHFKEGLAPPADQSAVILGEHKDVDG